MNRLLRNVTVLATFCITSSVTSLCFAASGDAEQTSPTLQSYAPELIDSGRSRFAANCGFCHGRDAAGGAQGLDLLRSELVAADVDGDLISEVVRSGRTDTNMPAFPRNTVSNTDLSAMVAYIHNQKILAEAANGGRRSVEPEDLSTGNADQGQRYFATACAHCHSASGDLEGIASRLQGLGLLRRMLYPGRAAAPAQVTVTTSNGQSINGALAYLDEFTVALYDEDGNYRSWSTQAITFSVDNPLDAHVDQLALYTDEDMHNVLAYLQTLR